MVIWDVRREVWFPHPAAAGRFRRYRRLRRYRGDVLRL